MRILVVGSGMPAEHSSLDAYVAAAAARREDDVVVFDLLAHREFYGQALPAFGNRYGIRWTNEMIGDCAGDHAVSQAVAFRPDLMLVVHGSLLPTPVVERIRSLGTATALWLVDDPYGIETAAGYIGAYDHVFTADAAAARYHHSQGHDAAVLALAGGDAYQPLTPPAAYVNDVCFFGPCPCAEPAWTEALVGLASRHRCRFVGPGWDQPALAAWADARAVPPPEQALFASGAKVNVNFGRFAGAALSGQEGRSSLRAQSPDALTFGLAACSAFQLTFGVDELTRYFDRDVVPSFHEPGELAELAAFYLAHDERRLSAARQARERAMSEHRYDHRLAAVVSAVAPR